jgi:Kef-type K+ transport system membrane component KefB
MYRLFQYDIFNGVRPILQVAWTLFILYPARWAFKWLARVTGSDDEPTPLFMTATILLVFVSAFMTDVIGK